MRFLSPLLCLSVIAGGSAFPQGYSPNEALERVELAPGLSATLFASEPMVRQPILVKVDDRGRLWTIQYLQYPNPAGLKRVKVDRWSRTTYDRVPEPPPIGPVGADRITILTDQNGDGRADSANDFVAGLNLTTGVAFGYRGVFVLQVPYLLFYPDRDQDDIPDSDPEVLLSGFGMEDAQSLANHLTWGPDGWLYGVNGSTTTCRIRGIEFQQGVWRYHPKTKKFELFCEGGGNTYGLTFDQTGNLLYSTNGGPFIHALQGAYYKKSFGKHGPLHNPYAYGYFDIVDRDKVPGGPPTGGTIYLADSFGPSFRGSFIAGNFLGHSASWWKLTRDRSSFKATFGGTLFNAHDSWFCPTDMCLGPDGSMYISDFHDRRTSHPDPDAAWDRSNGRIFKILGQGKPPTRLDITKLTTPELLDLLDHPNHWYSQRALVELAFRRDLSVSDQLVRMASQQRNIKAALHGLWALNAIGPLGDDLAIRLLDHKFAETRLWTARLIGDQHEISEQLGDRLIARCAEEANVNVGIQLAATAKRLPDWPGSVMGLKLLERDAWADDPRFPLMVWWAIESKAISDLPRLSDAFANYAEWDDRLFSQTGRKLLRRWAAEGSRKCEDALVSVLEEAAEPLRSTMLAAVSDGLAERGRALHGIGQGGLYEQFAKPESNVARHDDEPKVGPKLRDLIGDYYRKHTSDTRAIKLALQVDFRTAYAQLLADIRNQSTRQASAEKLELLGEFGKPDAIPILLALLDPARPEKTLAAALVALQRHDDNRITTRLLRIYPRLSRPMRARVRHRLFGKAHDTLAFLRKLKQKTLPIADIPVSELRLAALHENPQIDQLVRELWGNVTAGTTEEKLATMRRYNNDLRTGSGAADRGKAIFGKLCSSCHKLFGEGTELGPDLTQANRFDRAAMLAQIVDPNAVVRNQYLVYLVETEAGRLLTGLLAEQDAASITLVDDKNERTKLNRGDIVSLRPSKTSLMPERLLDPLNPQQIRDLFSYLERQQ